MASSEQLATSMTLVREHAGLQICSNSSTATHSNHSASSPKLYAAGYTPYQETQAVLLATLHPGELVQSDSAYTETYKCKRAQGQWQTYSRSFSKQPFQLEDKHSPSPPASLRTTKQHTHLTCCTRTARLLEPLCLSTLIEPLCLSVLMSKDN